MSEKKTALLRDEQNGFTLLEVMIAVVIIGFGVVAIGKFFSVSMLNSGFARQQTIALSLADAKIEDLRAYQSLSIGPSDCPDPNTPNCITTYDAISTGTETNGDFTINWSITPVTTVGAIGEYKEIAVTVAWTDLQNQQRSVQTTSVIGASDPKSTAYLLQSYAPPGSPVHPFNRVLKVPIPAVDQDNGTSSYAPPGTSGVSIILDNTSGEVVGGPGIPDNIDNGIAYYLLSGYISFGSGSIRPGVDAESDIDIVLDVTTSDYSCWDDSHLAVADKAYADFITYSCVIKAYDSISDGIDLPTWSGNISLTLDVDGTASYLSTAANVCRFDDTLASYTDISETLANQNFIVIKLDRSCPSGSSAFGS
ncbi:prepilin-type N-terminal cleavage/methylation domain-containing protein [Neptunomonas sp.]|uniref:prepilin-type N-terminal cleavage/methylation domain-containing protein n=1 Tax=Neptunomonas sp. TaxID=1971898 RepID=UPI003562651B